MTRQHIVVLSGAGISAESGVKTFRDDNGLWEGHRVEDVATPEAWQRNPELVLDFYNQRRRQLYQVEPNPGHLAIAELESRYRVSVLTQNVDNLHERAGSTEVVHLHGELDLARSTVDESRLYPLKGRDIRLGDTCELGSQLRPHVVWFGEAVPEMERAMALAETADILIVVGTSLFVYPAAGLASCAPATARRYLINPELPAHFDMDGFTCIQEKAGGALPDLVKQLLSEAG
ncbi:MAG TPA: NAD-dependent deacylase [Opitutales bacterium]|nr:NAD-dependent deacylase [Opitutales bacterium]